MCPKGYIDIDILLNQEALLNECIVIEDILAMTIRDDPGIPKFHLNEDKGTSNDENYITFSPIRLPNGDISIAC